MRVEVRSFESAGFLICSSQSAVRRERVVQGQIACVSILLAADNAPNILPVA
jgi:hypothetical protein